MIAYAESSAVLAWILGEPSGEEVRDGLARAQRVVSSRLTVVECSRAIARAALDGIIPPTAELAALRLLDQVSATWVTIEATGRVLDRARRAFPREPVRTLDALHLATALYVQSALPPLAVVSLDERIRLNALALLMTVVP